MLLLDLLVVLRIGFDEDAFPIQIPLHVERVGSDLPVQSATLDEEAVALE